MIPSPPVTSASLFWLYLCLNLVTQDLFTVSTSTWQIKPDTQICQGVQFQVYCLDCQGLHVLARNETRQTHCQHLFIKVTKCANDTQSLGAMSNNCQCEEECSAPGINVFPVRPRPIFLEYLEENYDCSEYNDSCPSKAITNLRADIETTNLTTVLSDSTYVARLEPFHLLIYTDDGTPIIFLIEVWMDALLIYNTTVERNNPCDTCSLTMVKLVVPDIGVYTIHVLATNDVSSVSYEKDIISEGRIKQFIIDPVSPALLSDLSITYLVLPVMPRPSNLFVRYKSTNLDSSKDLPSLYTDWPPTDSNYKMTLEMTWNEAHIQSINHIMEMWVWNNISSFYDFTSFKAAPRFSGVELSSLSGYPSLPEGAKDYPLEYPVYFNCTIDTGVIQWVIWEINERTDNTSSCNWSYTFPAMGTYNVTAVVSNIITQEIVAIKVSILKGVADLMLVNNGPVLWEEDVMFVLFVGSLGVNSSFSIDFGDGHSHGLSGFSTNSSIRDYLKDGLLLPFDPTLQQAKIIRHRYPWDGSYIAVAHGWDLVSSISVISEVKVNLKPCSIPHLDIRSGSDDFSSAPRLYSNHGITLHADMTVDCHGSDMTIYQWRLYKIDEVFPYASAANEMLFGQNIRTNLIDCYIPPFTLPYGDYIVEITVMTIMEKDDSVGMIEYDHSYMKLVPNMLVPRITGGSFRILSWYSEVLLDGSSSHDPDVAPSDDLDPDLIFQWYCRGPNETFPEAINDTGWECPACGCFNSGFLITNESSPGVDASHALRIPAQMLRGNQTYYFQLHLSKTGRDVVIAEQTIRLLPGNVTEVLVRCVINCELYINPSERLVLSGKCEYCTEFTRPQYQWGIIYGIEESGLNDIDWDKDTTTGKNNAYLAFKGGVFSRGSISEYTLKLTMHSWAGTSSHAEYAIKINSPPTRGTCSVRPTEGFVLFTNFYINCSMFDDVDTPLSYQLRVVELHQSTSSHLQDYSQGSLLHFGLDPVFPPVMLPLGSPTSDFLVNIAIIVTDAFGAMVVTHLNTTVREPEQQEPEEVFDKLINLTQGENSEMTHLLEAGDTQAATQLITTVSSILNSETEKEEEGGSEEDEGMNKEARIQVREQLITNLDKVDIHDMESLQLTSAAVAEVTKEEEEISTNAQLSASAIYAKMGNFLQEQSSAGATTVTIEGTARQLVSGVANIMKAASSNLEKQNVTATTARNTSVTGVDNTTTEADTSRQVTLSSINTLKNIGTAILHSKVPGEEAIVIKTEEVEILLNRLEKWEIDSKLFEVPDKYAFIKLPSTFRDALDMSNVNSTLSSYDDILDTHVHHFTQNPFSWAREREVTSEVTAIDVISGETNQLEVTDLEENINIFLDNNIEDDSVTINGKLDSNTGKKLFAFNLTEGAMYIMIYFKMDHQHEEGREAIINVTITDTPKSNVTFIDELNTTVEEEWNETATKTHLMFSLPKDTLPYVDRNGTANMTGDPYSILLEREMFGEQDGPYFMNIKVNGVSNWTDEWNLTVVVYSPWCAFWEEDSEQWLTDGCQPGPLTNLRHTHCICDHLSTFAGGFFPLPNALNLKEDILLFTEIFENPVTAVTVLCVLLVFSLCAYWARKRDKWQEKGNEVIFLADNDMDASHHYHVTVITGMRRGSGTSSVVTLILHGTHGSSEPHVLAAPHRPVLQRGGHDSFVIAVPQSLGELTGIRIWHDNSGSHPQWYISRVIVHDIQSNGWWYFLCHTWLGLEFDCIDKTFPVATKEDLTQFHHLFFSKMQRDIKDQHLWVSVMVCPPKSNFTRLQRTACCLSIVLTAMLASIIFYGVPEEYATQDTEISFGSMTLSWTSVVIGIESSLITFPINFLICEFFRKAKTREKLTSAAPSESSSRFTLSLDQITYASALSHVSSLYDNCKIFLSSAEGTSVDTTDIESKESVPTSSSSSLAQVSHDTLDSQKPLLPKWGLCTTPQDSDSDSEDIPDEVHSIPSVESDPWICIEPEAKYSIMRIKNLSEKGKLGDRLDVDKNGNIFEDLDNRKVDMTHREGEMDNHLTAAFLSTDASECMLEKNNDECYDGAFKGDHVLLKTSQSHFDDVPFKEGIHIKSLNKFEFPSIERTGSGESAIEPTDVQQEVTLEDIGVKLLPKCSDASDYVTDNQAERGHNSNISIAPLIPPGYIEEQEDEGIGMVFYESHGQYLQVKINQLKHELDSLPQVDFSDRKRHERMMKKLNFVLSIHGWTQEEHTLEEKVEDKLEEYEEFKGCLPWWSIYISWALVIMTCLVCSFFIILYGLKYGKQQSLDWLMSMFVSLFQSVVITQPFKVVVMSALIAIILPVHTHEQVGLGTSRIINARTATSKGGTCQGPARNTSYYHPPSSKRVEEARKKRIGQVKMVSVLKAFLGQVAFVFLVLEVAYMQRDPNTFLMKQALMNSFTEEADEVGTSQDLLEWMREVFVPALYGGMDGFVVEDFTYRIGAARLRQLRLKEELCHPFMSGFSAKSCEDGLDKRSYETSWEPGSNEGSPGSPWVYQPADILLGSRTNQISSSRRSDSGGYALSLGTSIESTEDQLNFIEELGWIDDRTRAVFIEWNLFNPNTNLLCVCCMLFERFPTGEYRFTPQFDLMRLLDLSTPFNKISLALEGIYIGVILVLIMIEVRKYQRKKSAYWGYWNLLTIFIILLSSVAAAVYTVWLTTVWKGLQTYLADRNEFHSFFKAAYLNRTFNYLVATIVFFASLKFAKILEFNISIKIMQKTWYFLYRKFKFALTVILIVFLSFSILGFLIFQATIFSFRTFVSSIEVMFLFVSGGFDQFLEVTEIHPFVGMVFFGALTLFLIYIYMNLMIMFIVESFKMAQARCREKVDHRDIVEAFMGWLFSCLGVKRQRKRIQQ